MSFFETCVDDFNVICEVQKGAIQGPPRRGRCMSRKKKNKQNRWKKPRKIVSRVVLNRARRHRCLLHELQIHGEHDSSVERNENIDRDSNSPRRWTQVSYATKNFLFP